MSDTLDNPEHSAAVEAALGRLDANEMAAKSNALTGGCLRGQDALNVARMVSSAALRTPGKVVCVAGIQGQLIGSRLYLAWSADIIDIAIPTGEEL